ncbi:MAG: hypothetical protein Q7J36_17065 [Thiobacillus sp.]|nr:hypothetical protein [Thiobacillus sp.]
MSEDPKVFHLLDLVPRSLDEIVRTNRDKFRLAFATDEEMKSLERSIQAAGMVRHTLEAWNVLMMHATAGGKTRSVPKLLGSVEGTGQCWITSTIKGIDLDTGLVQTENSLYRVAGTQSFEPSAHLLIHVCVFLNEYGAGGYLGIPDFYY